MKDIIQSLWIGPSLSKLEQVCLKSFIDNDMEFHLYTYEKVDNVPRGTIIKDGNTIMPMKAVFSLKSSFLPFSDIFVLVNNL